jgi:capsular exopolysaccharide synthesis family protein
MQPMSQANPVPVSTSPRPRVGGPAANQPGGLLTPRQLLFAIRRHWLLALILGTLVGGGAATAVWFLLPPGDHAAVRMIHISAVRPKVAFENPEAQAAFDTFKQTQMVLLRSRPVLNAALRSPKLANSPLLANQSDPIDWLEKHVFVRPTASPEIIQIVMQGSPDQINDMRPIVYAVTEAYLHEVVDKDLERLRRKHEQLREIASRYEKKLKGIRQSMRNLREQAGTGNPENLMLKQKQALLEYGQASQELTRLRSELRAMRTQLLSLEEGKTDIDTVTDAELDAYAERDPIVAQMAAEIAALERRIETESARAVQGRDAPLVKSLLADLKRKQDEMERRKTQMRGNLVDRIKAEKQRNASLEIINLRQRVQYLENLEKLLVKDCERLNRESKELHQKALDLEDFKNDLDEAEAMYKTISKQAEALAIEMDAPSRISDMNRDEGAIVQKPDELNRKLRFSGLAALGGLGLVVVALGLIEIRLRRVTSPLDLTEQLGLNVLGTMPNCRGSRFSKRVERAQSLRESTDGARTFLVHMAESEGIKTVLVSSAVPGEGKTTMACHLASSLARAGQRTLLIDGDLRKPAIHHIFERKRDPGLCEALRGEVPLEQSLYETDLPHLHILPAGRVDENALGLLSNTPLRDIMQRLKASYDFIVIDTSPLIAVPDSLVFARHADGVILSSMQEVSRIHRMSYALDRLRKIGARILGVVVHGTKDIETYGYRYYQQYAKRDNLKLAK